MTSIRPFLLIMLVLISATLALGQVSASASCAAVTSGASVSSPADHASPPATSDPCGTTDMSPDTGAGIPWLHLPGDASLSFAPPLAPNQRHYQFPNTTDLQSLFVPGPDAPPPNSATT